MPTNNTHRSDPLQFQSRNGFHRQLDSRLSKAIRRLGAQFEANALYFAVGVPAYTLAQLLRRQVLPAACRTVTAATLRTDRGRQKGLAVERPRRSVRRGRKRLWGGHLGP